MKADLELSFLVWLVCLTALVVFPLAWVAVVAATLYLVFLRWCHWRCGDGLERHVHRYVSKDLEAMARRLGTLETAVKDVTEAQVKLGGVFRGRQERI